ncbi:hypothetical protein OSB04_013032 [Centaurea solstitialis]|uniref:Uncharacterized protein n=1 Tax=Centaurea solstitialis TaxID=347529 RepID=A0AA38TCH5_9ASTR|nr:hypothetical protein OSB04_013032 [Centaurea solstitialis]
MHKSEEYSLDDMTKHLRIEEEARNRDKKSKTPMNVNSVNGKCHVCGDTRHYARECKQRKSGPPTAANAVGEIGELVANLTMDEINVLNMTSQIHIVSRKKESWYLGTGTTTHVCNDKSKFVNYKKIKGKQLSTANGSKADIAGSGDILLHFTSYRKIKLQSVLHVLTISKNLLSYSRLDTNGFGIRGSDGTIVFLKNERYIWKAYLVEGMYHLSLKDSKDDSVGGSDEGNMVTADEEFGSGSSSDSIFVCGSSDDLVFPNNVILGNVNEVFLITLYQAFEAFKIYKAEVENQKEKRIKILRSDRGGEYFNHEFDTFCEENGIKHEHISPFTPQQNGLAERKNQTLIEMVNCMLNQSGLPTNLLGDALLTACHIHNRITSRVIPTSPYELWNRRKPDLDYFRVWGCVAYYRTPDPKRSKLGARAIKSIFIGYAVNMEGNHKKVTREVIFVINIDDDHKTFEEAMCSRDDSLWREAINDEMDSIMSNGTWVLADLPKGSKPIGSKWIFKRKRYPDGTVSAFKARLVAKGYRQREGIDYFDTYVPVARISSIRTLIAISALKGLYIHQMDVKTTFLNGYLNEEVYMEQPEGFVMPDQENKVCKLVKSLYGLKQSPKQWHERFETTVTSFGFKHNGADRCIYSKCTKESTVVICLYVDDMFVSNYVQKLTNQLPARAAKDGSGGICTAAVVDVQKPMVRVASSGLAPRAATSVGCCEQCSAHVASSGRHQDFRVASNGHNQGCRAARCADPASRRLRTNQTRLGFRLTLFFENPLGPNDCQFGNEPKAQFWTNSIKDAEASGSYARKISGVLTNMLKPIANTITNTDNLPLRSILEKDKLTRYNFLVWERNLMIVLMHERKYPDFRTRLINTNAHNQLRDMFQTQARTERYDASRALNACKMAKGTSTKDVLMVKNGEVKKKRGHGNASKGKGQVLATLSAPSVYDIGKGKGKKVKPNRVITENQYFKCHEVGH